MSYKRPTVMVNGKQMLVSRVVMAQHLGRPLSSDELVHHINHDPFDNRLENLTIVTRSEHKKLHSEIGERTRIPKQWNLNANEIADLFASFPASEIARRLGCSYQTITRIVKTLPEFERIDLRSLGRTRWRHDDNG
jgi:hypothetical protein